MTPRLRKFALTVHVSSLAAAAAKTSSSATDLSEVRMSCVAHAVGGLVVVLPPLALSVHKPRGRTRHGRRKMPSQRAGMAALDAAISWVRKAYASIRAKAVPHTGHCIGQALPIAFPADPSPQQCEHLCRLLS